MDVSKNRGGFDPPKWMVKVMENPIFKWMIWGYHYFWKHPYRDSKIKTVLRIKDPYSKQPVLEIWFLQSLVFRSDPPILPRCHLPPSSTLFGCWELGRYLNREIGRWLFLLGSKSRWAQSMLWPTIRATKTKTVSSWAPSRSL